MKRIFPLFLFLGMFCAVSLAQKKSNFVTGMEATVNSVDFLNSKSKMLQYLRENSSEIVIFTQTESEKTIFFLLYVKENQFRSIDSFLPGLGYVSEKNITSTNNSDKVEELKLKIEYLQSQKNEYSTEIAKMTRDDRYYQYWNKIREYDKEIMDLKNELRNYEVKYDFRISLTIRNDIDDLTSNEISWVNMPGIAGEMLFTENPYSGKTSDKYYGYLLKYMFTRGKTYSCLGTFKSLPQVKDSTTLRDLFLLSFGQDFYTRHFGRGKNKFFNLYSGYHLGGMYGTSKGKTRSFCLFANVCRL